MQKGSELCCSGVKPTEDGAYCKDCGFVKGSEKCCADENAKCAKCGLAKGSDLCCKEINVDAHEGHDHAEGDDEDQDHAE